MNHTQLHQGDGDESLDELRRTVAELRQERDDLEIALSTAIEHGDAIEDQLGLANQQLQTELRERRCTEKKLRELVDAISRKSQDLELLVKTITEHSDTVEDHWLSRYEESAVTARTDALTDLANRRMLDETLAREWARARRHGEPLAMLVGDIDYFKFYNDHYGHQSGDECLKRVAQVLQQHASRDSDLAARYGGEEFVVLLPATGMDGAALVGQSIQKTVHRLGLTHEDSPYGVVTLSVGIAALVPDHDNESLLFAEADRRLYLAKQQGRNRVVHNG